MTILAASDYSLIDGLLVVIIGIGVNFLVLTVLMGLLYLLKFLPKAKENAVEQATAAETMQASVEENQDEELVAVITAAIVALREGEGTTEAAPFRIKNIKRI